MEDNLWSFFGKNYPNVLAVAKDLIEEETEEYKIVRLTHYMGNTLVNDNGLTSPEVLDYKHHYKILFEKLTENNESLKKRLTKIISHYAQQDFDDQIDYTIMYWRLKNEEVDIEHLCSIYVSHFYNISKELNNSIIQICQQNVEEYGEHEVCIYCPEKNDIEINNAKNINIDENKIYIFNTNINYPIIVAYKEENKVDFIHYVENNFDRIKSFFNVRLDTLTFPAFNQKHIQEFFKTLTKENIELLELNHCDSFSVTDLAMKNQKISSIADLIKEVQCVINVDLDSYLKKKHLQEIMNNTGRKTEFW